MDNCFWNTSRSRGIVDNHGVLEADANHGRRLLVALGKEKVFESLRVGDVVRRIGLLKTLNDDNLFERRTFLQSLHDSLNLVPQINCFAIVQGAIVEKNKLS